MAAACSRGCSARGWLTGLSWRVSSPRQNGSAGPKTAENSCRNGSAVVTKSLFLSIFVVVVGLERAVKTCQLKLSIH